MTGKWEMIKLKDLLSMWAVVVRLATAPDGWVIRAGRIQKEGAAGEQSECSKGELGKNRHYTHFVSAKRGAKNGTHSDYHYCMLAATAKCCWTIDVI